MRPTFEDLRAILAIAIAYYAVGRLGLLVAIPPGNVTFLWLPAGIALAALYAMGARWWPGVWLGALAVNVEVFAEGGIALGQSLALGALIATGAVVQAILGAWLLRRSGGLFKDVASVFRFGGPIAFGTCLLNATVGVTALCTAGMIPWTAFPGTWLTWWLGDSAGVLVATPFILAWWQRPASTRRWRATALGFLALALVSAVVFLNAHAWPIAYLPVPLVVWLSLKYRLRGAVSATALVFAFALAGALSGLGPYEGREVQEALMLFCSYVVVVSLTALVLVVVEGGRRQADRGLKETLTALEENLQARKRMEDRLRESEHRFRTLAMRVPVGIFMTDAAGDCVFVNERWRFFTGLTEAQALGTGWASALHPIDRERVSAEWEAAVAAGREFSSEYRFMRPDGSFIWVYGNASPLDPDAGGAVGYVGTLTDLTERIEAERLKLSFVNAVSHDLRTPLASIMGFAEFLEDGLAGPLNPAQGEYLSQIQRGVRRLEQLVDDLLDFATIEAGSFRLSIVPVDFGALLREVAASLRPQAEEGQLALELEIAPDSLLVPMDCRRIERVVMNLLQNAIKFSPQGGSIVVRAVVEGDCLRCEVVDRGRGIPTNDLPKLFKPFGQLEAGNVKGGAGLGLSISKSIVEAHHGTIGVRSTVGEGSTFWFTLPLSTRHAPVTTPCAPSIR
ncbi:MASE1 domain-containing protein [bacterium]|nr:MASE1 domain-containing protein [bacterium]